MKKEHILVIQYPHVRITVLSRGFARPFFENLAPNVGFMEADLKKEYHGIKGLNALYRRLAAKQFTAVADLHSVLRSSFLRMRFSLNRYHVAHINKHRKGRRNLTSPNKKQLKPLPTSFQNYADVLARLGYPVKIEFHSIFDNTPTGKGDLSLLPESLSSLLLPPSTLIGIAPFAAHEGKIYPLQLTEQVIKQLTEQHPDARILLFGRGERESKLFTTWCQHYQQCIFVSKHLENIHQELILMSHLNAMLSMDSANMHMASLVATPVVSVWGATHPYAGFMGWGQKPENIVQVELDCRPCSIYGQKPCLRGDYACMNMIKPEIIVEKINFLLQTKQND